MTGEAIRDNAFLISTAFNSILPTSPFVLRADAATYSKLPCKRFVSMYSGARIVALAVFLAVVASCIVINPFVNRSNSPIAAPAPCIPTFTPCIQRLP